MRAKNRIYLWLCCSSLLTALTVIVHAEPVNPPSPIDTLAAIKQAVPAYAPDRLLVRFKAGTAAASQAALHRQAGGQRHTTIPRIEVQVIKVLSGSVLQKLKVYRANPNVEFAEPDYHRILVMPGEGSDAFIPSANLFTEQWGLHNTGQLLVDPLTGAQSLTGTADADIDAPEAWDIHSGDASIKLAVLDTGGGLCGGRSHR